MSGFISSTDGDFDRIYVKKSEIDSVINSFLNPITPGVLSNMYVSGNNDNGQLGLNDKTFRNSMVRGGIQGTKYRQVACGSYASAAIDYEGGASGTGYLWVWGTNLYGQMGDGASTVNLLYPTQFKTTISPTTYDKWRQVSCGDRNMAAIREDNTLWIWGTNEYGQMASNSVGLITTLYPPTQVRDRVGQTSTPLYWKSVSCGVYSIAAIDENGFLWSWGDNSNSVLGFNDATDRYIPTKVGTQTWSSVVCCVNTISLYAINTANELYSAGLNGSGQLGINNTTTSNTRGLGQVVMPTGVANSWKMVDAHSSTVIGITSSGKLYTWGSFSNGRFGDPQMLSSVLVPTARMPNDTFIDCGMGLYAAGAIKTDGTLWTWGVSYSYVGGPSTHGADVIAQTSLQLNTYKSIRFGAQFLIALTQ